ncbi:MAG: hypothetical protein ACKVYV_07600 [Limisphaerales bacterium]
MKFNALRAKIRSPFLQSHAWPEIECVAGGKVLNITVRSGSDGIILGHPDRTGGGAGAVFQKTYERRIQFSSVAEPAASRTDPCRLVRMLRD